MCIVCIVEPLRFKYNLYAKLSHLAVLTDNNPIVEMPAAGHSASVSIQRESDKTEST